MQLTVYLISSIFALISTGPALLRSRNPLIVNQWTRVVAERQGRDGTLVVNEDAPVNGKSLFCTAEDTVIVELCVCTVKSGVEYALVYSHPCLM